MTHYNRKLDGLMSRAARFAAPIIAFSLLFTVTDGIAASGSDISSAKWTGVVQVSNNGTALTNQVIRVAVNTTNLINDGYLNSSANNCAMQYNGTDLVFMPGFNAPWCIFQPLIGASSIVSDTLYLPATGGQVRYFPGATGANVTDAAMLELSANFTVSFTGRIADNQTLLSKPNACSVTTGSGNVTAAIPTGSATNSAAIRPNGPGAFTQITNLGGAATHWQAVSDSSDASYVYEPGGVEKDDTYAANFAAAVPAGSTINSVNVTVRGTYGTGGGLAYPLLYLNSTLSKGALINLTATVANYNNAVSRPGGGSWSLADLASLQLGVGAWTNSATIYEVWAVINYTPVSQLSTTYGAPDIEQTVRVHQDGAHWWITTAAGASANVSAVAIPDTSSNYTFMQGVAYCQSWSITVGGVEKGRWQWQYDSTFTDLSGNGNTAYPSFPSSNPANVTVNMTSFTPVEEAKAPAYAVGNATAFITANSTMSGSFGTNSTSTGWPGIQLIKDVSEESDTPIQLPLVLIVTSITLILAFCAEYLMKKFGNVSPWVHAMIITCLMGIAVSATTLNIVDISFFLILALALVTAASSRGSALSGTGTTGNNTVGFLAMSFIGLTYVNRLLEGRMLQASDISTMNSVLAFKPFGIGAFSIPIPNLGFFTDGLPNLMRWDYSFFGGNAQIITYTMYSMTAAMMFICLVLALGFAYQTFRTR